MVDLRYSTANNLYKVNFITPETEEQRLLKRLAQGDRNAFWSLWESYRNYLYHRCLVWMGGNHDDAEEVMSLASLKAWEKLPNHALNITNLKGWLNRFTHNLCIDIHRQRKHKAIGVDNVEDVPLNNHEIGFSDYPESELLEQELHIHIRNCIDSLSPRLRDPLILSYYQEMSHADIGKELTISQGNVAKRLQEGRQILKKSLGKYFTGSNTEKLNETQCHQELEQKDLHLSIDDDSNIEEINYRITISCLETLPPVWLNFHYPQDWI
ncbi:MAG: RNA polymerase sigma factor [Crocosphaera sp.]|nr:RNA polymerase sigma factor [Crocosphaera sp.]